MRLNNEQEREAATEEEEEVEVEVVKSPGKFQFLLF